ncbi:MAG: hypothetical protein K5873_12280 [Treponema sp.]|nr:hypothetical protein [Treponema sp.]
MRRFTLLLLLLFSAFFRIFAQENLRGNALSKKVERELRNNGLSPYGQELSSTGQDEFAYNIILEFEAKESLSSDNTKNYRDQLIFSFYQEDFEENKEVLLDFIYFIRDFQRRWKALILFSALDKAILTDSPTIKGSEVFAASIDNADSSCAIAVEFQKDKATSIYTGSKNFTSPLWLLRGITDSFYETRKQYEFQDILSSIYRLGIISGRERLSFFFNNSVPAIELNFRDSSQLSLLKDFAKNYSPEETEEWDMHYISINRGNIFRAIYIKERFLIISCLTVGILTILILCIFSFTGEHGQRHKYEFIRSIYMIPFTLAISFLSLYLGQFFAGFISQYFTINPIFQYGIKIIFSMIFISLLFVLQGMLKISVTAFMYGYLLSIVSIFNIFLFSTRDLNLFVIFVIEYVIIYLSRNSKSLGALIFYYLLMLLPFIPYGTNIIKSANDLELAKSVFVAPLGNLLLSFAIFPFQITWLRMLVFVNVRAGVKGYTIKKMIVNGIISTFMILAFIFTLIFLISHFIYRDSYRKEQKSEIKILKEENFSLSVILSKNEFLGMNTNHIKISSSERALRYQVTLQEGGSEHSIYDSIYAYELLNKDMENEIYSFIIPDWPPEKITIDYAAPVNSKGLITVKAFYETDEKNIFRMEERELKVE